MQITIIYQLSSIIWLILSFDKLYEILSGGLLHFPFHPAHPAKEFSLPAQCLTDPGAETESIAVFNDLSILEFHKGLDLIHDLITGI